MAASLPNYFSLFHLEPRFDVDCSELTRRYRDVQSEIHPDRFAGKSSQEQRLAVQQAAYVNEAYQCLRQPLARAKYLLGLLQPPLIGVQAALDHGFLMEQMELRDQLDALSGQQASVAKLEGFCDAIEVQHKQLQQDFLRELKAGQFDLANTTLAKWQFMDKLMQEAEFLLGQQD